MIFVTSDTHFGHENILKYEQDSRPFATIEEMNEKIIENWNSVVSEEDTVYMLGDMFLGSVELIDKIMPRLKGKKILIRGNHDSDARVAKIEKYCEGVYSIYNLKYKDKFFVMCHYPIREWQNKEHGAIHLYGHVHSNEHRQGVLTESNSFHVGMDTNQLTPISIDEVITRFEKCKHQRIRKGEFFFCNACGKQVRKYKINNKEVWL